MRRTFGVMVVLLFGAMTLAGHVWGEDHGPDASPSKVLFVYDSSNSMWGELADGSRKYQAGRDAMAAVVDGGLGDREIAFRAYGHRRAGDCRDSELVAPFAPNDEAAASIVEAANTIRPTGKTPITYSLQEGLKDLDGGPGEILLISDGIETCDADPCDLMREWSDANVDVRVHVVGVGLSELERDAMACIADVSGGEYFDADSAEALEQALGQAGDAIQTTEEIPVEPSARYAIIYKAHDASGREYTDAEGKLFQDGVLVDERTVASGRGRNRVDGPGDYEIEVGVLLNDGTTYEPVRVPVTVEATGDTILEVEVPAPARVNAVFNEDGQTHNGTLIRAYQDGVELFSFRPGDEAYAKPETYEFRTTINSDNQLSVTQTLVADALTTVRFELIETVRAYVAFELPDGTTVLRHSELWRDGEKLYSLHSRNGGIVQPGVYELRSDDQNLPLTPVEIRIDAIEDKTYTVPLDAGWVMIRYVGDLYDYARESLPTRAHLHSVDRGNSKYSRPGSPIPVAPGRYAVEGFGNDGFFDRLEIDVASGETVEAVMEPKPLGELVAAYAPSENYLREPDRASAAALDGQRIIGGILRPGDVRKFLPGRYRITGWQYAGDIVPQDVVVRAGERTVVELKLEGE